MWVNCAVYVVNDGFVVKFLKDVRLGWFNIILCIDIRMLFG